MVRIAISQAAFDAIAKTLPLGSVGYENKLNEKGERLIWLDRAVVDRLRALRGPGESYSDVSSCDWRRRAAEGCAATGLITRVADREQVRRLKGQARCGAPPPVNTPAGVEPMRSSLLDEYRPIISRPCRQLTSPTTSSPR